MFPSKLWANPIWCLYDNTSGQVVLKHPWREGLVAECPYCGEPLAVEGYRAQCCGQNFKTGFGEIRQIEPVETHDRRSGRGWPSLRAYCATEGS